MNPSGFHVALIEPEIPQNTGNIGRTCVATGSRLHLVAPLGFSLDDRQLKRAGLDYWPDLSWELHPGREAFFAACPGSRFVLTRSRGGTPLYDHRFEPGDVLVFGRESVGLPAEVFAEVAGAQVTIPMTGPTRSLNIANSVSIVLFEALRQLHVRGLPVFAGAQVVPAHAEGDVTP